jgi:type IV pilus assembly protein PilA
MQCHFKTPFGGRRFTLVEIMVVVVIIAMLAAMAIPAFANVRENSIASRVANDLRIFSGAFTVYALSNGAYPADVGPGVVPWEMSGWVGAGTFTDATPAGGNYDWDYLQFGVTAGVSVFSPTVSTSILQRIDRILDNGDLSSGAFRDRGGGYIYVIED